MPNFGNKPSRPRAKNSTAIAASISPIKRVTILIPMLPSRLDIGTDSLRISQMTMATNRIGASDDVTDGTRTGE